MPETDRKAFGPKPANDPDTHVRTLIGQAIRVRREKAGMTQAEAAGALGISERTLRDWEAGRGSLWTGGDAGCVDHAMMRKLREAYAERYAERQGEELRVSMLMPRNQYPSAPLDPVLRRDWVRRRNAMIQGVDVDEYLAMCAEQDQRRGVGVTQNDHS
jgi:transcriptional regulator with XRE-family HTH domain